MSLLGTSAKCRVVFMDEMWRNKVINGTNAGFVFTFTQFVQFRVYE